MTWAAGGKGGRRAREPPATKRSQPAADAVGMCRSALRVMLCWQWRARRPALAGSSHDHRFSPHLCVSYKAWTKTMHARSCTAGASLGRYAACCRHWRAQLSAEQKLQSTSACSASATNASAFIGANCTPGGAGAIF